jgi:hypothetical protein
MTMQPDSSSPTCIASSRNAYRSIRSLLPRNRCGGLVSRTAEEARPSTESNRQFTTLRDGPGWYCWRDEATPISWLSPSISSFMGSVTGVGWACRAPMSSPQSMGLAPDTGMEFETC